VLDDALRADRDRIPAASLRRYERETRATLKLFSWFIYRITTPAMRQLFMGPRDVLGVRRGIVSLLAADIHRHVPIRFALGVFKFIYYVSATVHWRETRAWRRKYRQAFEARLAYVWKSGV
jgi:hypothetical protein